MAANNSQDIVMQATQRGRRATKRNKPTLNCLECVERKAKCDRVRPSCWTCIRRQTSCRYTPVANLLASASSSDSARKRQRCNDSDHTVRLEAAHSTPLDSEPSILFQVDHSDSLEADMSHGLEPAHSVLLQADEPCAIPAALHQHHDLTVTHDFGRASPPDDFDAIFPMTTPIFANAIETFAPLVMPSPSSTRPSERHALLNLFGAASAEHPFRNYWTDAGGLVELIASLPSKVEADVLVARFFDMVDPVCSVVPRDAFVAEVERFWSLPDQAKHRHDPAQLALQFAVYANAAHDIGLQGHDLEAQLSTATFYLSCCHQSLCISSYLNRCSLLTVQSMILICHFMIGCDRITDAWSISGIVQRQIYGLKLHRSPTDLGTNVNDDMVQVRLRLWQAAMLQDVVLSLSLERPASMTYFDVNHCELRPFSGDANFHDSDVPYMRSMWQCSALIEETICSPRSSQQPLAVDATHKSQVIARFRELYTQFEEPFCQTAPTRFDNLPPRLLCQMVTVASTYFYALMLLCIDKSEKADVHCDPSGAIKAAHEGMTAFFALARLFPGHLRVWTAAHNRTYAMGAVIGTMLISHKRINSNAPRRTIDDDPQLMLAKSAFDRYMNMLSRAQGLKEFRVIQRQRLTNLRVLEATLQDA